MSQELTLSAIVAAIAANTAAIEANTAALGGKAPAAKAEANTGAKTTAAKPGAGKPKPETAAKSVNTRAAMQSLLNDVKEEHGSAKAKELINDVGGVAKMSDIPENKIDEVFEAAKAVMAGEEAGGDEDGGL